MKPPFAFGRAHAQRNLTPADIKAATAADDLNRRPSLITHTLGSGSGGDVIFSFPAGNCGDPEQPPRHARAYGDVLLWCHAVAAERVCALTGFAGDVRQGVF